MDATQFQELANGLALSGRPFLWVVRPKFTTGVAEDWFDAFKRRVDGMGLVVGWSPQQRVLSHDWALQLHGFFADTAAKSMRFDVVVSFDIDHKEAVDIMTEQVRELYPDYEAHIISDIDATDI